MFTEIDGWDKKVLGPAPILYDSRGDDYLTARVCYASGQDKFCYDYVYPPSDDIVKAINSMAMVRSKLSSGD